MISNQIQNQNQNQNPNPSMGISVGVVPSDSRLQEVVEKMPKDLSMHKPCTKPDSVSVSERIDHFCTQSINSAGQHQQMSPDQTAEGASDTKIKLSFSVDRLLNDCDATNHDKHEKPLGYCDIAKFSYCTYPRCGVVNAQTLKRHSQTSNLASLHYASNMDKLFGADCGQLVRPTPIRAVGDSCDKVSLGMGVARLNSTPLIRYQSPGKPLLGASHLQTNLMFSSLMQPLAGLKTMPQQLNSLASNRLAVKAHALTDLPAVSGTITLTHPHPHAHHLTAQTAHLQLTAPGSANSSSGACPNNGSSNASASNGNTGGVNGKRKRSWSRAVFSNLQRKGLEIQFQQQKYITKPDRRKLAARLNLTDAQVKVWFQNRRMKWRHTRENLKSGQEKQITAVEGQSAGTTVEKGGSEMETGEVSDGSSSANNSEHEDEDDHVIDVVE